MSRPLFVCSAPLGQIDRLVVSAGDASFGRSTDVVHDRLDHMRLSEEVGFDLLEVTPLNPPLARLR